MHALGLHGVHGGGELFLAIVSPVLREWDILHIYCARHPVPTPSAKDTANALQIRRARRVVGHRLWPSILAAKINIFTPHHRPTLFWTCFRVRTARSRKLFFQCLPASEFPPATHVHTPKRIQRPIFFGKKVIFEVAPAVFKFPQKTRMARGRRRR